MNNEEKNLTPETEGAENNKPASTENTNAKKGLSTGLLAAIIGGAVAVLVAVILLIVLLPGNNSGSGDNNNGGTGDVQPDEDVTYTATLVDQNGDPVENAIVMLYFESGDSLPCPTDANGKASYKGDKKIVSAAVFSIPNGYEFSKVAQNQKVDLKDGKVTITITKKAVQGTNYTIRVVDQNGNPVANVYVQMCESEDKCLTPIKTNANGEAVYTQPESEYKAAITSLPEGYEKTTEGYTYFESYVAIIEVTKTAE